MIQKSWLLLLYHTLGPGLRVEPEGIQRLSTFNISPTDTWSCNTAAAAMSEAFILGAVNMTNQWEHYRLQTTNHKSRRKCHVHVIILIQIENKKPSNATMSSADFQVRSQRWNVTAKYNSESDLSLSSPNPKIHIPVNFGGEGGVVKKKTLPYFVVHLKVFDALRNVMENLKALKSLVNSYRRTRLGALELEILKPLWDEFSNCKVNKCIRMWYLLRLTCLICLIMAGYCWID